MANKSTGSINKRGFTLIEVLFSLSICLLIVLNSVPLIKTISYKDKYELVNGIDRLDSSKGYTINNCVPCCSKCNLMKSNFKKEDFLQHISKIYNFSISSTTIPKGSTSKVIVDGSERIPNLRNMI